mgnify:FL=1
MHSTRKSMAANAVSLAIAPVVLAAFILGTAVSAQAHRVNIFAWTEGNEVVAECGFNGGNKVKQGQVVIFDAATGAKVAEGRTDDLGVYRFPISAEGKAHGVRIVIKAGEGHQNEWTVDAAELATIQPGTAATSAPAVSPAVAPAAASTLQPQAAPKADKSPAQQTANISAAEMQNIVNTALDAKLGPIRKELAEMRVARPGFSEIFGGIGWLVGLAGIALYFKGRRG